MAIKKTIILVKIALFMSSSINAKELNSESKRLSLEICGLFLFQRFSCLYSLNK